MAQTLILALGNFFIMLIFIILGYALRQIKSFPKEGNTVMSMLVTLVFVPASNIHAPAQDFTVDNAGQKLLFLGAGIIFLWSPF